MPHLIIKLNDMCNRSGLDTISTGGVIAFAMECFENGVISKTDTDGIELTWGNSEAMIALVEKIIQREGFGDILADGVRIAAQKIGGDAKEFAIHVGGQEPGLHNALFLPGRGTGFVCDPTPGRHTAGPMARIDAGSCAGVCLFPVIFFGNYPLLEFLNAVTGWDMDIKELLETGARIQTLRQCYNIREGLDPSKIRLPPRLAGIPPKEDGPLADITIDIDSLASEYRQAMGWDPNAGHPTEATLERLGLKELVKK